MNIEVPYGRSLLSIVLPDDLPVDLIKAPVISPAPDPLQAVRDSLDNSLGNITQFCSVCLGKTSF